MSGEGVPFAQCSRFSSVHRHPALLNFTPPCTGNPNPPQTHPTTTNGQASGEGWDSGPHPQGVCSFTPRGVLCCFFFSFLACDRSVPRREQAGRKGSVPINSQLKKQNAVVLVAVVVGCHVLAVPRGSLLCPQHLSGDEQEALEGRWRRRYVWWFD